MHAMQAMLFTGCGKALLRASVRTPHPGPEQVLIRVGACAVCRTDLHIIDGELARPKLPLILGHEIVGVIERTGARATRFGVGARVGVPWLGWTCGNCRYCRTGRENLCAKARFTGYHIDGGYAQYALADQRYCFAMPEHFSDAEAAPLLCAGLIGYRALRLAGPGRELGIYGFGAAAHLITQVALHQGRRVYAFTRDGDLAGQRFARALGASWAGPSSARAPRPLDAALIFAPVGALVPVALRAVAKGGCVVCGGIHMSDIPAFAYADLWGERCLRSVANLTREDGEQFLALAPQVPVRSHSVSYPLARANEALADLRHGRIAGAAVLLPWAD